MIAPKGLHPSRNRSDVIYLQLITFPTVTPYTVVPKKDDFCNLYKTELVKMVKSVKIVIPWVKVRQIVVSS